MSVITRDGIWLVRDMDASLRWHDGYQRIDGEKSQAHARRMNGRNRKWLPSGGTIAGMLAGMLVLFIVGMPMMAMTLQSSGCDGAPRPCETNDTLLYVAFGALFIMLIGTWWGVRRLFGFFRGD